jgi:putative ABC transport system permease protein
MGAVWMCARVQVRARRNAMIALGLLLAVMSGAATAAAVGARRTETAYPRLLAQYRPYDLTVTTGGSPDTDRIFAQIAALPMVRAVWRDTFIYGSLRTRAGREADFPDIFFFGTPRRSGPPGYKILAGRDLDPDADDEAIANYAMAERLELHPGDRVTVRLRTGATRDQPTSGAINVRIVGIIAAVGFFDSSEGGGFPTTILMSPAFKQRWARFSDPGEDSLAVFLRRGEADADAFDRALKSQNIPSDGPAERASAFTQGVQDLNSVPAVALWLLCAFIAVTALAIVTQLLAREIQLAGRDDPVLRAVGLSRRELLLLGIIRGAMVAALGAAGSVAVAVLLSPLTPVGLARIAEPNPGFTVAPSMLAYGAAATLLLTPLLSSVPAWLSARAASAASRPFPGRGSSLAQGLARIGFPSSVQSGMRLAYDSGRGERAVPVRTAALGMTIAIVALAAALGFALSLKKLIETPRLSGYTWDAGAIANAFSAQEIGERLPRMEASIHDALPDASFWRGTVFLGAAVDTIEIGAVVSHGPPPSVINGRAPRGTDEVALDRRSLRQLHKGIGRTVTVAISFGPDERGVARRMKVVGTFVVPRVAFQGSLPGQGVAFSPEAASLLNAGVPPDDTVFVHFGPRTSFDRGLSTLRSATAGDAFALVNRQQSATVGNVSRLSALPLVLSVIIGLLGTATLAHALTTTIRRRRRDVAILKTLGFVRRQVRGTVAWQCTTLTVTALAIGLPLGIVAGRWGWRLFATQLQVVPLPVTSWLAVGGIALGTIALGNLIALGPGLAAARTPAAVVLRTE